MSFVRTALYKQTNLFRLGSPFRHSSSMSSPSVRVRAFRMSCALRLTAAPCTAESPGSAETSCWPPRRCAAIRPDLPTYCSFQIKPDGGVTCDIRTPTATSGSARINAQKCPKNGILWPGAPKMRPKRPPNRSGTCDRDLKIRMKMGL